MLILTLGVAGGGIGVTVDALSQHLLSPGALLALWLGSAVAGVAHQINRWRTGTLLEANSRDPVPTGGWIAVAAVVLGIVIATGAPLEFVIVPLFGGFTVAYLPYLWWIVLVLRPAERRE